MSSAVPRAETKFRSSWWRRARIPLESGRFACDTVTLAVGAVPVIELLDAAGCRTAYSPERGGFVPVLDAGQQTTLPHLLAAGDGAGIWPAKSREPDIAREEGRRAARSAATALGRAASDTPPPPAPSEGPDSAAYRLDWVRATVIDAAGEPHVCRCEEVTAREILEVRPPRYLGWKGDRRNQRDLASLLGEGAPNPDLVKRLTRAGMGVCQGRRCREQVAALLALGAGVGLSEVPLATHRAPVRPLPLSLAARPESPDMAAHWDTWFGMASQYVPFWDAPRHHLAATRPGAHEGTAEMSAPSGASVVIIGGGATGLSAGWWLAREGVDVVVIDKGIVGWEASGRNGGGCSHHFSPLFREEQRLWPQMDELLGYPTEFRPYRIRIAFDPAQLVLYGEAKRNAERQGFATDLLDPRQVRELVPLAGEEAIGGYFYRFGGHANPHRTVQAYAWAMQDHGGRVLQHTDSRRVRAQRQPRDGGSYRPRHDRLRPARARGRAADRPARPPAGRRRSHGRGARRDDRHRAPAADADRRRRRQRPLWPSDPARQSRLWRRSA